MLKPQAPDTLQNITLGSTLAALRRREAGLLETVLNWLQAQSARALDVMPGEEFRVAMAEGQGTAANESSDGARGNTLNDSHPLDHDSTAFQMWALRCCWATALCK